MFFTDGDLEVDAIKHIFAEPSGLEAWRLKVYFQSIGAEFSESYIEKLLQTYEEKIYLYKYPFKNLYVLNMSSLIVAEGEKGSE